MTTANTYKTKQREIILNYLKDNSDKHLTIESIGNYLDSQNEKVGQTTIYRYVNFLVEEGLVRKYIIGPGQPACFQYAENSEECEKHYHLKCNDCKKVLHVNCKIFKNVEEHLENRHNFEIDSSKLLIYGTCNECR